MTRIRPQFFPATRNVTQIPSNGANISGDSTQLWERASNTHLIKYVSDDWIHDSFINVNGCLRRRGVLLICRGSKISLPSRSHGVGVPEEHHYDKG